MHVELCDDDQRWAIEGFDEFSDPGAIQSQSRVTSERDSRHVSVARIQFDD
jgi:hypothetical protein